MPSRLASEPATSSGWRSGITTFAATPRCAEHRAPERHEAADPRVLQHRQRGVAEFGFVEAGERVGGAGVDALGIEAPPVVPGAAGLGQQPVVQLDDRQRLPVALGVVGVGPDRGPRHARPELRQHPGGGRGAAAVHAEHHAAPAARSGARRLAVACGASSSRLWSRGASRVPAGRARPNRAPAPRPPDSRGTRRRSGARLRPPGPPAASRWRGSAARCRRRCRARRRAAPAAVRGSPGGRARAPARR